MKYLYIIFLLQFFFCFNFAELYLKETIKNSVRLFRHSAAYPFHYDMEQKNWTLSDAASNAKSRILLGPSSTHYIGHFWNDYPIMTDEFTVFFTFEFYYKTSTPEHAARGFAFWYVLDAPKIVPNLEDDFFGYKPTFNGLGIFFSIYNQTDHMNPTITAAVSDGTKTWNRKKNLPQTGVMWNFRLNRNPMTVRVTIKPNHIEAHALFLAQKDWTLIFKFNKTLPRGGHIGFTADTRPANVNSGVPDSSNDFIYLTNILTYNLNPSIVEEPPSVKSTQLFQGKPLELLLIAPIDIDLDEKALQQKILAMSDAYNEIMTETLEVQYLLRSKIGRLAEHLVNADREIQDMKKTINLQSQPDKEQKTDSDINIAQAVSSLTKLVISQNHVATRAKQVTENLIQNPRHSPKIDNLNQLLHHHTKITWMLSLMSIFTIMLFALFLWKKTRDFEKKHFL